MAGAAGLAPWVCDDATQAKAVEHISMFFFTTYTPAQRIENEYLIKAFALRGVKLPSRKQLMSEHLDACFDHKRSELLEMMRIYNGEALRARSLSNASKAWQVVRTNKHG